jgi:hypothetical protein
MLAEACAQLCNFGRGLRTCAAVNAKRADVAYLGTDFWHRHFIVERDRRNMGGDRMLQALSSPGFQGYPDPELRHRIFLN